MRRQATAESQAPCLTEVHEGLWKCHSRGFMGSCPKPRGFPLQLTRGLVRVPPLATGLGARRPQGPGTECGTDTAEAPSRPSPPDGAS